MSGEPANARRFLSMAIECLCEAINANDARDHAGVSFHIQRAINALGGVPVYVAEQAPAEGGDPELPGIEPAPTITLRPNGSIELAGDPDAAIRAIQRFVHTGQDAQAAADEAVERGRARRRRRGFQ